MPRLYTLIKVFNKKEYADQFMNGKLYSNTISYFKNIEDESSTNRNDKLEAITASFQSDKVSISLNNHLLTDLVGQVTIQRPYLNCLNIFCMYSIHNGDLETNKKVTLKELNEEIKISDECLQLGDFAVIITNLKEFFERIKNKVKKENYGLKGQLIQYYDASSFHGTFSDEEAIFRKRDIFKHQKEYRFVFDVNNTEEKILELDIGDISDITMLMSTKEINDELQLNIEENCK